MVQKGDLVCVVGPNGVRGQPPHMNDSLRVIKQ